MNEKKAREPYFKGLTRMDYIQKANEIIKNEGVGAVSIRRIAKEMGCSTASLYRHFSNLSELLYYAELRNLEPYIGRLNKAQKSWDNIWDIYVGVWDCYSREAFKHPDAYNLLFFKYSNSKMQRSIREYYEMFPSDIEKTNRFFYEMLQTPDFFSRDFEMCKKCIRANAITYENAVRLNRMVCMLFKGYFKTVLDEGVEEEEIEWHVDVFVKDVDAIVFALAKELYGYEGYKSCW